MTTGGHHSYEGHHDYRWFRAEMRIALSVPNCFLEMMKCALNHMTAALLGAKMNKYKSSMSLQIKRLPSYSVIVQQTIVWSRGGIDCHLQLW